MLFRSTTETDLARVCACIVTAPISWVPADRYLEELAEHQYRPEWTWIAQKGDQILARTLWWGLPESDHPLALDCLSAHDSVADRIGLAAKLLAAAHDSFRAGGIPALPEYDLNLPNGWRDDPDVAAAAAWRQEAAARAGLTDELERLCYEWTPDAGVPEATRRLVFSAEPEDEVFVSVFRRVAEDSVDVTTRRNVAAMGADRRARKDLQVYLDMPGKRDRWRVAFTPDGQLAGLAIPSWNPYGPVVGYLGVVPELRGRDYVDELPPRSLDSWPRRVHRGSPPSPTRPTCRCPPPSSAPATQLRRPARPVVRSRAIRRSN